MPRALGRSTAEKRLKLKNIEANPLQATDEDSIADATLASILSGFQQYIPGMIETLGAAAQPTKNADGTWTPGDVEAAKKVLDFLGKALAGNKADNRGADMLRKIAEIRNGKST